MNVGADRTRVCRWLGLILRVFLLVDAVAVAFVYFTIGASQGLDLTSFLYLDVTHWMFYTGLFDVLV